MLALPLFVYPCLFSFCFFPIMRSAYPTADHRTHRHHRRIKFGIFHQQVLMLKWYEQLIEHQTLPQFHILFRTFRRSRCRKLGSALHDEFLSPVKPGRICSALRRNGKDFNFRLGFCMKLQHSRFKRIDYCIANEPHLRKVKPVIAEDRATVCAVERHNHIFITNTSGILMGHA